MFSTTYQASTISTPQSTSERLTVARELFQEFRALCFWHSPRDLEITKDLITFVAKGLRANGGRLGFTLAGKLEPNAIDRETLECR